MSLAQITVSALAVYALVGTVTAILFLVLGIDRVEPAARGAYAFRPLIVPGLILLWPLVLWRWHLIVSGAGADVSLQRGYLKRHRRAWALLAITLPLIIISGLALRQSGPLDKPAVPLDQRAKEVESEQ